MLMRTPVRSNARRRQTAREKPLPFPVGGWDAASPLASMPADRAVELRNWFPQPGYGEVRRGYRRHCGSMEDPVETLMAWRGPTSESMFAAAGTSIYDVTSAGVTTEAVTGLTDTRWQHVNISTAAGHFLVACNGVDAVRHYNGSAWATPTINNVSSSDLVHVNSHKRRLWFVETGSTDAWYLATEAVAGDATKFALGSLFSRGGYLMAMGTWTRDGGSGADDFAVFISSEGQVAIYQGTDPASANTWALVGVFDVPPPIGRRCFFRYGADLGLVTLEGVFQLSKLLSVDQSQVERVALSERISRAFNDAHRAYGDNWGWEACIYPKGTRLIVNMPTTEGSAAKQYVMNTLTGAWCEFDSHNAQCWLVFGEALYFGGPDGTVYKADTGAVDDDQEIVAVGQSAYTALGSPYIKRFMLVRPLVTASGGYRPEVGVSVDFAETDTLSAIGDGTTTAALFDSAVFDTAVFAADTNTVSDWIDVSAIGQFGSIKFRGRIGVAADLAAAKWGTALWGTATWGAGGASDETLRINGFMMTAEVGAVL